FLNIAERHAEYYLLRRQPVPPWDYDAPLEGALARSQPDSSAGAIAAVGLLNLSTFTTNPICAGAYENAAMQILEILSKPPYLAIEQPSWEGILKRSVYHIHKNLGVD